MYLICINSWCIWNAQVCLGSGQFLWAQMIFEPSRYFYVRQVSIWISYVLIRTRRFYSLLLKYLLWSYLIGEWLRGKKLQRFIPSIHFKYNSNSIRYICFQQKAVCELKNRCLRWTLVNYCLRLNSDTVKKNSKFANLSSKQIW